MDQPPNQLNKIKEKSNSNQKIESLKDNSNPQIEKKVLDQKNSDQTTKNEDIKEIEIENQNKKSKKEENGNGVKKSKKQKKRERKKKKEKRPPRPKRDANNSPNLNIDFNNLNLAVPDLDFLNEENSPNVSQSELHRLSIAPMLDVTDRNFRVLMRMLSRKVTLYTDMVHCDTILFGNFTACKLRIHPLERPVVMQLGGSNPDHLAKAAVLCERAGYDEINLNVGCPSPRVQKGAFGACLMKEPELVAECVAAMEKVVSVPVTVKCRLGVDDFDSYEFMKDFVRIVGERTKCTHFIIHARKAFLKGLNPKENRNVPPLMYNRVYQIAKDFPQYQFSINGGIKTFKQAGEILDANRDLLGVMIGRTAYQNTWHFADLDRRLYGVANPGLSRKEIFLRYGEYADMVLKQIKHFKIPTLVRPLLGIFAGEKGNRIMRRFLSDKKNYYKEKSFLNFMKRLVEHMEEVNSEALNRRCVGLPKVENEFSIENFVDDQSKKIIPENDFVKNGNDFSKKVKQDKNFVGDDLAKVKDLSGKRKSDDEIEISKIKKVKET